MRDIIEKKYTPLDIEFVNRMAQEDPEELVQISEGFYNYQVADVAKRIEKNVDNYKFVLLCGPSASGKTTTAHKLKRVLNDLGIGAQVMSMDNFFKGMGSYPALPNGKPDMESILAVDLELLNECFEQLTRKGRSIFPVYDFVKQRQFRDAQPVVLEKNDVLIMEGIHALNPRVLIDIPKENIFRIYASVRAKFVNGDEAVLIPKDIRLMRRMVRDNNFRNYSPVQTLENWVQVLEGERENINPYRDDVDFKMDNTIDYEVCVWRNFLSGLLSSQNLKDYDEYPEIKRIFDGLARFPEIDYRLIPENSLLREFIGES